jgi:hypothetical protein
MTKIPHVVITPKQLLQNHGISLRFSFGKSVSPSHTITHASHTNLTFRQGIHDWQKQQNYTKEKPIYTHGKGQ